MKIDEVNPNLGFIDALGSAFNALTTKSTGSGFNPITNWLNRRKTGLSREEQLAYDIFVDKFVRQGTDVINRAAQVGLFDPNSNSLTSAASSTTAAAPAATPSAAPAQRKKKTASPSSIVVPSTYRQKQTAGPSPSAGPTTKAPQPAAGPIVATWGGAKYTKTKQGWVDNKNRKADPQTASYLDQAYQASLKESIEFLKMKYLYESIVSEAAIPSISQWVKDNFVKPYLQGINLSSAETQIDSILQNLPQSFANGTHSRDLRKIAEIAWALRHISMPQSQMVPQKKSRSRNP